MEESIVDFGSRVFDAARARAEGEEYQPADTPPPLPSRFIYPTVIILGMLAALFGIASMIRSENALMAGSAIAFGISASFVIWTAVIAGVVLSVACILLVCAIVSILGS